MTTGPKEAVYDAEIAPLMAKIIEACKRANIAMIADFELDPQDGDPDDPLLCTTAIVPPTACLRLKKAAALLRPRGNGGAFAIVITHTPEKSAGDER